MGNVCIQLDYQYDIITPIIYLEIGNENVELTLHVKENCIDSAGRLCVHLAQVASSITDVRSPVNTDLQQVLSLLKPLLTLLDFFNFSHQASSNNTLQKSIGSS